MPPTKSPKSRAKVARAAPYPASKPTNDITNKENASSQENASPQDGASPAATLLPDSYLDIELEEAVGFFGDVEVPCYENACPSSESHTQLTWPGHYNPAQAERPD